MTTTTRMAVALTLATSLATATAAIAAPPSADPYTDSSDDPYAAIPLKSRETLTKVRLGPRGGACSFSREQDSGAYAWSLALLALASRRSRGPARRKGRSGSSWPSRSADR